MTARPSHAMKQQEIDDALASLPSSKWRWLFTPDAKWMASINTTTLREVNAVRMFVGVTLLYVITQVVVVGFAMLRCGVLIQLFGMRLLQILPPSGKVDFKQWQLCEDSNFTRTLLDFADSASNGYYLLLATMASVAAAAMIGKRLTDTEHKVKVEEARKGPAPTIIQTGDPAVAMASELPATDGSK